MSKLNQRGFIAQALILILLILGAIVGVYLVQNRTNLLPKAGGSRPLDPQNSFTLMGPKVCKNDWVCYLAGRPGLKEEFEVKLYAKSDLEEANLFTAKMIFPKDVVEVKEIKTEGSFIKNWVEEYYNNETGEINLSGGVPNPGYKTQIGQESILMATITLYAKGLGKGEIAFTDSSAIYSNLNNINILTMTEGYDISVQETPQPTAVPTPKGSRVFITSTRYNGNLGGLEGADAKCQARADAANLGGVWKAWLSDSTTSVASRFTHDTSPYKLLNGTIIAYGWDDLTDGVLQNPININEFKAAAGGTSWTNTDQQGQVSSTTSNTTCNNWTSNDQSNRISYIMGNYMETNSEWTMWRGTTQCETPQTLYCFEQSSVSPAPTPAPKPTYKGDGNKDGKINLIDMSILHTDWQGSTNVKKDIRTGIDMNDDGLINTMDFAGLRQLLQDLKIVKVK